MCQAPESYCGDGIVGTGVGYTNQEQCDDCNTNPFEGCVTSANRVPVCLSLYCGDGYIQVGPGEVCDDGNTINGDGCQSTCTLTPNPGVCASVYDNQPIYDFNNGGDAILQTTPGLCAGGTLANFAYNTTTHTRTWTCQ